MITGFEIVVVVAVAVVAFLVLRPYVPNWAWYTLYVGVTLYGLVRILAAGLNVERAALVVIFALAAAVTWWRDLRGAARDGRPPGPPSLG